MKIAINFHLPIVVANERGIVCGSKYLRPSWTNISFTHLNSEWAISNVFFSSTFSVSLSISLSLNGYASKTVGRQAGNDGMFVIRKFQNNTYILITINLYRLWIKLEFSWAFYRWMRIASCEDSQTKTTITTSSLCRSTNFLFLTERFARKSENWCGMRLPCHSSVPLQKWWIFFHYDVHKERFQLESFQFSTLMMVVVVVMHKPPRIPILHFSIISFYSVILMLDENATM